MNTYNHHIMHVLKVWDAANLSLCTWRYSGSIEESIKQTHISKEFCVATPSLWNKLPVHTRNSDSIDIFHHKLKVYLFPSPNPLSSQTCARLAEDDYWWAWIMVGSFHLNKRLRIYVWCCTRTRCCPTGNDKRYGSEQFLNKRLRNYVVLHPYSQLPHW